MDTSRNDTLWLIFQFIGKNWGDGDRCDMSQNQFQRVVQWQAARDPEYARYYDDTVLEYKRLLTQYGSSQRALRILYAENRLPNPKLPDIANCVLLEFMRWQVALGGFRSFAYMNYRGWMGSGSYLSVPPPYRALPNRTSK